MERQGNRDDGDADNGRDHRCPPEGVRKPSRRDEPGDDEHHEARQAREDDRDEVRRVQQHRSPCIASATTPNDRIDFRNSAIAMHAAVPSTGCMSGARSMAPMTTAAEFADSPMTATITDNVIMTVNLNAQWSWRLIANSAITRWRSEDSRCRCHH